MKLLREKATKKSAHDAASAMQALDYALMDYVTRFDCVTLKLADELVAMQRRLRRLRYQIEVEGGIELAPKRSLFQREAQGQEVRQ